MKLICELIFQEGELQEGQEERRWRISEQHGGSRKWRTWSGRLRGTGEEQSGKQSEFGDSTRTILPFHVRKQL